MIWNECDSNNEPIALPELIRLSLIIDKFESLSSDVISVAQCVNGSTYDYKSRSTSVRQPHLRSSNCTSPIRRRFLVPHLSPLDFHPETPPPRSCAAPGAVECLKYANVILTTRNNPALRAGGHISNEVV